MRNEITKMSDYVLVTCAALVPKDSPCLCGHEEVLCQRGSKAVAGLVACRPGGGHWYLCARPFNKANVRCSHESIDNIVDAARNTLGLSAKDLLDLGSAPMAQVRKLSRQRCREAVRP